MKTIKHKAFFDGEVVYNASRVGNALYWDDGKNFDLFAFKQQAPPCYWICPAAIIEEVAATFPDGEQSEFFQKKLDEVRAISEKAITRGIRT